MAPPKGVTLHLELDPDHVLLVRKELAHLSLTLDSLDRLWRRYVRDGSFRDGTLLALQEVRQEMLKLICAADQLYFAAAEALKTP